MAKKRVTEDGEIVDAVPTLASDPIPADEMLVGNEYKPFFKTPFNHDTHAEAMRTGTDGFGPTLTQQHAKDETDINLILEKFGIEGTRELAPMPPVAHYDAPDNWDMATALDLVARGTDAFMALPAKVRSQFDNDLARFSGFVQGRIEAGDRATLRELGIDAPEPPQAAPDPAKADTGGPA